MIGVLEIPALNAGFSDYAGALRAYVGWRGPVMKDTSLPVGGEDTNCVIAGHQRI